MTTNPPGEPSPWSHPTSGYPGPTSGQPNPSSGQPAPGSGYPAPGYGYPAGPPADQGGYPNAGYPTAPNYPNPGYPGQAPGYQAPGAWDTPGITPYPAQQPTNSLATASLVTSIVAFALCGGALGIVGALMGHSARRQIQASGEAGEGLATAGIVVGWIGFGLFMLGVVLVGGIFILSLASYSTSS